MRFVLDLWPDIETDDPSKLLEYAVESIATNRDLLWQIRNDVNDAVIADGVKLPEHETPAASDVRVRFSPEAWMRDNAIPVDPEGETEWNVTEETAAMVRDAIDLDFAQDDDLAPEWVRKWSGPFTIRVIEPVYPDHSNDLGDWCPYSGEPVQGADSRCPQGCRDSADDDEDED